MIAQKIAEFIATVGYIGKVKYAPGTFGSIAAFALILPLLWVYKPADQAAYCFYVSLVLFVIGTIASHFYSQGVRINDPKEVVIDEVCGQILAVAIFLKLLPLPMHDGECVLLILILFGTFRFFDIIKPWPIYLIDRNIKGGLGIMLDDFLAGIFAGVTSLLLIIFLMALTDG